MEVRKAPRKITCTEGALIKSPGKIIKTIKEMDRRIKDDPEETEEIPPESSKVEPEKEGAKEKEEEMDIEDDLSSTSDAEELMGETDIDEESINISITSTVSQESSGKKKRNVDLNVTDADGKLDLSKIRSWSIPKLNRS